MLLSNVLLMSMCLTALSLTPLAARTSPSSSTPSQNTTQNSSVAEKARPPRDSKGDITKDAANTWLNALTPEAKKSLMSSLWSNWISTPKAEDITALNKKRDGDIGQINGGAKTPIWTASAMRAQFSAWTLSAKLKNDASLLPIPLKDLESANPLAGFDPNKMTSKTTRDEWNKWIYPNVTEGEFKRWTDQMASINAMPSDKKDKFIKDLQNLVGTAKKQLAQDPNDVNSIKLLAQALVQLGELGL